MLLTSAIPSLKCILALSKDVTRFCLALYAVSRTLATGIIMFLYDIGLDGHQ